MNANIVFENQFRPMSDIEQDVIAPQATKLARYLTRQALDTLTCYTGGHAKIKQIMRFGLEVNLASELFDKLKEALNNAEGLIHDYIRIDCSADLSLDEQIKSFWTNITITVRSIPKL